MRFRIVSKLQTILQLLRVHEARGIGRFLSLWADRAAEHRKWCDFSTSGELRISNFMLWQAAYSEIYVTETLWPDFRRADLLEAVVDYQRRDRRFGGLKLVANAK